MPRFDLRQNGFTLIEIVSVLVILGVLAVVAVPKYLDLQSESEKKTALASVSEAQARIQLRFGQLLLQGNTCEDAAAKVNTLSMIEDSSNGNGSVFGDFILSSETITKDGVAVYAKRKNSSDTAFDTGAKLYLPQCDEEANNGMGTGVAAFNFAPGLYKALEQTVIKGKSALSVSVESNAVEGDNNWTTPVKKNLESLGIDPSLSNIKSWAYSKDGTFYWSETDTSSLAKGDTIIAMSYNISSKTYSVGIVTLSTQTSTKTKTDFTSYASYDGKTSTVAFTSSTNQTGFTDFNAAKAAYDAAKKKNGS